MRIGVLQNYVKAHARANVAAAHGHTQASKLRDALEESMSPQQIQQAQQLADRLLKQISSSFPSQASEDKAQPKGSGTGFLITRSGYLLTCYHVIEGAESIHIQINGKTYQAEVIQLDRHNDLALLNITGPFSALAFSDSRSAKLGEIVFTIGFPNPSTQGANPKLTKGEISSLTGYQDDPRLYQVSVPVQLGNSGGPLVNEQSEVCGVVVSSLDAKTAFRITGAIPQNVNYAVKSTYALALLDSVPEVSNG